MCAGNLEQAKIKFDQVLELMGLKVETKESDAKNIIPDYLVTLLIYFYMKTSNHSL